MDTRYEEQDLDSCFCSLSINPSQDFSIDEKFISISSVAPNSQSCFLERNSCHCLVQLQTRMLLFFLYFIPFLSNFSFSLFYFSFESKISFSIDTILFELSSSFSFKKQVFFWILRNAMFITMIMRV